MKVWFCPYYYYEEPVADLPDVLTSLFQGTEQPIFNNGEPRACDKCGKPMYQVEKKEDNPMLKIYIAGKLTADNPVEYIANVKAGNRAWVELMKLGHAPMWSGMDFVGLLEEGIPVEQLKAASMEWLKTADVILLLPNSELSSGVKAELDTALNFEIPVIDVWTWDTLASQIRNLEEMV